MIAANPVCPSRHILYLKTQAGRRSSAQAHTGAIPATQRRGEGADSGASPCPTCSSARRAGGQKSCPAQAAVDCAAAALGTRTRTPGPGMGRTPSPPSPPPPHTHIHTGAAAGRRVTNVRRYSLKRNVARGARTSVAQTRTQARARKGAYRGDADQWHIVIVVTHHCLRPVPRDEAPHLAVGDCQSPTPTQRQTHTNTGRAANTICSKSSGTPRRRNSTPTTAEGALPPQPRQSCTEVVAPFAT